MSFQFVNVDYEHPMSKASKGKKQQSLEWRVWQLCFAALICCSMGWMEQGLFTGAHKTYLQTCESALSHTHTKGLPHPTSRNSIGPRHTNTCHLFFMNTQKRAHTHGLSRSHEHKHSGLADMHTLNKTAR